VVLTDPDLVEAQAIELLDDLDILPNRHGGMLAGLVVGTGEHAEAHLGFEELHFNPHSS